MNSMNAKLLRLQAAGEQGYWGKRIVSELEYAYQLSRTQDQRYDHLLDSAIQFINREYSAAGTITKQTVLKAEEMLREISAEAKKYQMICAAHAHIDMNWMWRWDETVAISLDTFRTMLDLMKEYPDFTFSQSQASVYKIVEDYAPEMLEEIKARVKEGRWEVTASTWVEADKNIPNGESMARHILYTKRYLSRLLDIEPDSLNLDFEPDTFGHSINVPEILARGGVKYYYHCRGAEGHNLLRWVAPSGRSIIVYREPFWYNAAIEPEMTLYIPQFCQQYGLNSALRVYGVGDHGGGPTRQDIEKIRDMNTWPIFPTIKFGTFREYFGLVEKVADKLPEVKGERNFVFTGCYTSQSRIKKANRVAEGALSEAEAFGTMASLATGAAYRGEALARAWQNVLFNQFHDIIPGSGVVDTREYAMGLFQETMAIAGSSKKLALQSIASQVDTSGLIIEEDISGEVSEGAGVGFGVESFKISQASRGAGKTRIFHIFNPSLHCRKEPVEIVVWNWKGDLDRIVFQDGAGNIVNHQLLDRGFNHYWGHHYVRVLVEVEIPACGYRTYVMREKDEFKDEVQYPNYPRLEEPENLVLENEFIRAAFDSRSCALISLVDKKTGQELVDQNRCGGVFRLIQEDTIKGMTAWRVGRYMSIQPLGENLTITGIDRGALRQTLSYEMKFASSKMKVNISLDCNSPRLNYSVECDWQEIGKPGVNVPQLNFYLPVNYDCVFYKYDVPFGVIERQPMDMDVPANSWMLGVPANSNASRVLLVTDSKNGFRGFDNSLAVTLIRSSYDPDPYPEVGIHKFNLAICVDSGSTNKELIEIAYDYNHPLSVISDRAHAGTLPLTKSFLALEGGSVVASAVKMPEERNNDREMIIRVYETEGKESQVSLSCFCDIEAARLVDLNEKAVDSDLPVKVAGNKVTFSVEPFSVASLYVKLT